jgi:predicted  nucleic acid-binding Zn-ribbon protein
LRSEEKNTLELEKQALTIELSDMKADLLSQMGANDSLNGFIQYETQRLGALIDSINTVNVQNKKQLTAYRSRIAGMKKQNDALVAQLDSTNAAYAALKLREQMIADSLNNAMDANANLQGQNTGLRETVEKGQQLVIASSTVQAVRIASNGKERKTRRAKRADQLNACITLAKNRIAEQGETTLYAKWIGPNGKPVDGPEANVAVVGGERSNFNGSATVNFTGEATEVCIAAGRAVDAPVELAPGIYTIAVMTDNYLVGTVAVELK